MATDFAHSFNLSFMDLQQSEAPVNLLSVDTPYVNTAAEAVVPFRSTTYVAKYVPARPVDKGTIYLQDPSEEEDDHLCVYELSYPQLYTKGYRSYIQKRRRGAEVNFPFPPAPPDFDSNTVRSRESVVQYVRGLATAYNSMIEEPSVFEIYNHAILESVQNYLDAGNSVAQPPLTRSGSAANLTGDSVESSDNSETALSPNRRVSVSFQEGSTLFDETVTESLFYPHMEAEDFSIALFLSNVKTISLKTVQLMFVKLVHSPQLASMVSSDVVEAALTAFSEFLQGSGPSNLKSGLCSLMGIIICSRGRVMELLHFLKILEEYNASSSNIVPLMMPHAKEILQSFSFQSTSHLPVVSPIDCYQEDAVKIKKITLKEGTSVKCFCVSPNTNYLAMSTVNGLVVYDFQKGSLIGQKEYPTEGKSYWNVVFSDDSQHIICTDESGINHTVVTSTLSEIVQETTTSEVSVPLNFVNNELECLPPPYLSYGNSHSLYLFQETDMHLISLKDLNREKIENFTICSHIYKDFCGNLVTLGNDSEALKIDVKKDIVTLSQGDSACYGIVPSTSPWLFLQVKWCKGAWSLYIDFTAVELRGARYGPSKEVSILSASCVKGVGHIGSLAAWAQLSDSSFVRKYYMEKQMAHSPHALFNFPFDEGEGMWAKETVSASCKDLPETLFVWDSKINVPYTNLASKPSVRLKGRHMVEGKVLTSAFRIYIVLPSDHKGADDIVAEADRNTNVIIRVYRCPRSSAENLYSIFYDESELLIYHQRFSTFSRVRLFTKLWKEKELSINGIKESDKPSESIEWFLSELYKRIHLEGTELQRVPEDNSPLLLSSLDLLASLLKEVTTSTSKIKVLALLSLTLIHFNGLLTADESHISRIANTLKIACLHMKDFFTEKMIQDTAAELLNAAMLQSLPLDEKAKILLNLEKPENEHLLKRYISRDTLRPVINYIVTNESDKMKKVAQHVIEVTHKEALSGDGDHTMTGLVFWFVVNAICSLQAVGKLKEITDILEVFVDFASKNLTNDSITGDMRYTVYHAGLIPLLVIVAARCPSVVSPKVEEGLLALSSKIKLDCEQPKVPVSFITREACDVYPPSRNASQLWRFLMNFRNATSVSVLKESTKPLHILYEDKSESGVRTSSMSADWTFLKINNGGKIVFFGDGEITFTTVAQYDFKLNTSWANLLRCTVRHLLLQYCQYLTTQPRNADLPLTPLFRNGLSSVVLEKHDIKTDASSSEINDGVPLPLEILEDTGEGKVYVDRLLQRLRNSVIPSMRPAIQAILAILVHCGCTVEQAEDEVKVRWISGEWGAKLQSANRNSVKELLISLAKWVTTSVRDADLEVETPRSACAPPDKRYDSSFNNSQRSTSDRRSSSAFPQRRSFVKNSFPSDCLEQIRFMVSREVRPEQVEKTMVERVKAAILIEKGLSILGKLLDIDKAMENDDNYKTVMTAVVDVLWRYMVIDSGAHYIDSLSGCGAHLEMKVRVTFHAVLKRCEAYLIGDCPKDIQPQVVLKSTPDNGRTTMKLFAILCHPWDYKDSEFIVGNKSEVDMLKYLEGQLNVPIGNLTLTSPWRLRREDLHSVSEAEEETVKSEYMGAADLGSLSRLFPNDFSFVIPQFQTSRTSDGIVIQKNSSAAGLLRADEGWPLQWKDGLPRVFYFETKITAITGKLEIGLHSTNASNAFVFFYDSTGGTHSTMFPAYGEGDCVGCGLDTTNRKVFFTLNGKFLFFVGAVSEKLDVVFPALHFDDVTGYHVSVNFGTNAFLYDFRQLHPALNLVTGPTWYRVASTAEIVLYYITCCACSIPESKKIGRQFLSDCCEVAGRSVNKVTSSLMNLGVGGDTDPRIRIKQAVIFSVAEYSIMVLISTMRRIVSGTGSLSDSVSDMIFDAASVLMLLPLHSIQISTISLLPAIIPHVHEVRERSTFSNLVRTLFEHAKEEDNTGLIPFVPTWCECDSQYMSIVNVQTARMIPESQRSIVLGNVLPRTGTVSFSVKIRRGTMSKAHSLKGGYFIGISIAGLNPLSPASNSHSWKAVKPPIVWAIHDTSPQLSHATNPTVKSNNFQRTFGNGDVIKVVVNRDTRSVDFYREGEFLKTLFNGIPTDIDLVPFVQLYNDDASATIMPGEMTAPITAPTLLSAASVDVLRSMLTLDPFQDLVSAHLCEELETQQHPKVTLALFNSVADPRVLELRNSTGERQFVTVSRITDNRCKFSIGDEANYEHMYNLRTPAKAKITCLFDAHMSAAALHGLSKCVEKLVAAARRLVVPLITIKALNCQEMAARQQILDDERDHWDFLLHGTRCSNYAQSLKAASANHVPSSVPLVPLDYTYSSDLSHPSVLLSPQYCGRLATVHTQSKNTSTPFIAIAEPSVPLEGKCSIRCQLIRGHNGQILGGGYYFGVCAESFTWKRKELHSTVPEVWAIHDMDDTPWRLRHMHPAANFTITAEPRCIIVSGDTIRLEITRNGKQPGTMHAFRKPINGDEVCLGLIYDNLPPVKLYPFVHLFNTEAVAVLLGSNSDIPAVRLPIQQPHLAICPPKDRRFCDGCTAQHSESRLSSTWFKCNECADYSLCRNCFNMCIHSYHSFTLMGESKSQAHSNYPPARLAPGMEVVVPGTSCAYIKSAGCKRPKKYMNCLIESYSENAVGLWGMVHNGKRAQFTTVVSTLGGEPLTADMPVFIGITTSEEVIFTPREKLREQCFAMAPHLVTYCSDPNVRCKLDNVSRCPYGFQNGSRITFDVDVENKTVTIIRDWIVVGSHALEFNTGSASRSAEASSLEKSQSVFCFISLGKKNIQASILPEIYATVPATVEEVVNPRFVKVKLGDGSSRFLTTESCRMPLYPSSELSSPTFADLLGYTFLGKKMVQVKGTSLAADKRVQIKFLNGDPPKEVPDYALLVDQYESIEEERVLNEDSKNVSATIEEGFVISRLLLIIACLCENEMLTPLVMLNSIKLLDIINGLSSVEISNETPLYFIKEIRDSVAVTADCMQTLNDSQRLAPFVPTFSQDERRRRHKQDMLVCCVNKEEDNSVYRILSRKGEQLRLQNIANEERVEMSYRRALPVKQSNGKPWAQVPDGMPSTLLEHTIRVSDPARAAARITVSGIWEGEVELGKNQSHLCEINFMAPHFGKATIAGEEYTVLFNHSRYERRVHLCLFQLSELDTPEAVQEAVKNVSADSIVYEDVLKQFKTTPHSMVSAELDAEGFHMQGTCRQAEGQMGSFWCISTKRISLIPSSTEILHVEPLPNYLEVTTPSPPSFKVSDSMHRLIVLLARHLYLVISNQTRTVSKELIERVSLFDNHPLTDRIISRHVELQQLFFMMNQCTVEILDTTAKPWDVATLAQLLTRSFLLRPDVFSQAPESLIWDALHAVVVAAHRCGRVRRQQIIRDITTFVENNENTDIALYVQLFSPMVMYIREKLAPTLCFTETNKDISAGVDLVLTLKEPMRNSVPELPLKSLLCLIDLWKSLRDGTPLPNVIQTAHDGIPKRDTEVEIVCTFGELEGNLLKVGKVMSSCTAAPSGKFYYEVVLPERSNAPFAVGWGTSQHSDVPSQHVGCDRYSFSFSGTDIATRDFKEEYKIPVEAGPLSVIGCLLDMDSKEVCWSVNGTTGPPVPIPITFSQPLYAFASIGTSVGMKIRLKAEEFEYAPDNFTDLSLRYTRLLMDTYNANERSKLPVKPLRFFTQLASYLSDLEDYCKRMESDKPGSSISTSNPGSILMDPRTKFIPRYSALQDLSETELDEYAQVVAVVESCMATATRFIDLDGPTTQGSLSLAFIYLKSLVRASFREKLLLNVPPMEKASNLPTVLVNVGELYSTLPRTPEVALNHSILAQLYKQIGSYKDAQLSVTPLFKANYQASGSGHAPIDMGGPYRQVWTALTDEMMQHPDKCHPHSEFHRNPLFVFVNNSQRVALVPDSQATSPFELTLFNFFGKLMGYCARAKIPLNMDFSPYIWRFLIDDVLTIEDYYKHVDSVVEKSIEDDAFLMSEVAEEIIPNFAEKVAVLDEEEMGSDMAARRRRQIAEDCLVHSMDLQLQAMRSGLWCVMPRRVVRCSSWQDLEKLVCGSGDLSIDELKRYINTNLHPTREKAFWQIVASMTDEQRSSLLCFASGQRRLPLFTPITITENNESVDHLPRAQSCSSLITIPPFSNFEVFREKLLLALQHVMEMELA